MKKIPVSFQVLTWVHTELEVLTWVHTELEVSDKYHPCFDFGEVEKQIIAKFPDYAHKSVIADGYKY